MGRRVAGSTILGAILVWATASWNPLQSAPFIRGDVDANRAHELTDGVLVLSHLFQGDPATLDCDDAADVDDSGALDISDAIYLLNFLFLGGEAPPHPFPRCGLDHTEDLLGCLSFPPCPTFCGGFAGFPCGEGEACDLPPGLCNGGDLPGNCVILPEKCPEVFEPVCGCDGVTYANDCQRLLAGVQKEHEGECDAVRRCGGLLGEPCAEDEVCELPAGFCEVADLSGECVTRPQGCPDVFEPVCGCDGITYSNDCERLQKGVQKDHDGECEIARACGGIAGTPCGKGEFCELPEGSCDVVDLEGECVTIPDGCEKIFQPVCGCDGTTYGNDCERRAAGVQKAHEGACAQGKPCGGIAGFPCESPDDFCDYPAGTCGVADLQGECVSKGIGACPAIFDPVCGCDGVTYSNDCFRRAAGVSLDHHGPCEQ